ncbi:HAD-like domain-containing protein [Lasiosphaeria miniovina]|uniref:HAD-like domain-containing protein n=1 Tax=Lasiosphaeria miniovina TaxID=1954250 RepID=A0AA40DVL4_9PEZI|nr:HAD-like domain-containing protein [Lasiosphaeria miniovina]KAK0717994.1 HAD-like domain-containing protein [Lasiosphaeria miniovina]
MAPRTAFPSVRACLFDMDGLLLDTEDLYSLCCNLVLEKYQKPKLPWSIKAKLQGRPGPAANKLFHDWAQLPITEEEYSKEYYALQAQHFPGTQPLPGIEKLLNDLGRTRYWDAQNTKQQPGVQTQSPKQRVHIALATSSHESNFRLKTAHLEELFSVFETQRRVLGDDKRIPPGRGKPLPDIYLLALQTINESLPAGEAPIKPEECLVFEDSVPGVEAGRRAGMRVIWCPHPMLKKEYAGREAEVLAARTGEAGQVDLHQLGEVDDGWAEYLATLVDFPYDRYGITVPPVSVDEEEYMKETARVDDNEVIQAVDYAAAPAPAA